MDSDRKRASRLLFQPLLVAWALGATDARRVLAKTRHRGAVRRNG